jgi:hypothetical protein
VDKKVYLISGDVKISVDNVDKYFTGTTTSVNNSSTSSNTTGDISTIQGNEDL